MGVVYDCRDADSRATGLAAAAEVLQSGRLVVAPTDTVYAVAADAFNSHAVRALRSAVGRANNTPVPILVGSWSAVDGLALSISYAARQLIEAFWPGGLSLVLHSAPSLQWDLGDTRGTVMLRMPLHPVAIELLQDAGPLAHSGANRTGAGAATTLERAREQLGNTIGIYLDGGPCAESKVSTTVDLTGEQPVVLRAGVVSLAEIGEVLGHAVQLAR